jgi:ketosteroid isomerase-like protein
MSRRIGAPVVILLLSLAGPAAAQVLPFPQESAIGPDLARYAAEVRVELERALQEWVNAWEAGDGTAVSRFYADEAVIVDPSGSVVRGRAAAADYWTDHREPRSDMVALITQVSATNHVATARGRVSTRVQTATGGSRTESGDLLLVFERQRGVWMKRVHAVALDAPSEMSEVPSVPRSIRATGHPARVPEATQLRWRAEPFAGTATFAESFHAPATTMAGLGVGLEIGRVLEIRGSYWHGLDGDDGDGGDAGTLRTAAGEVRIYGFPASVARPYALAGAAKMAGGAVADLSGADALVPMFGGGLAFELPGHWGAHLDTRTYLLPRTSTRPGSNWISQPRSSNWSFSGGLSYSVGRYRAWHDPPVPAARAEYEGQVRQTLASLLGQWLDPSEVDRPRMASFYAPDVRLVTADGRRIQGASEVAAFWAARHPMLPGSLVNEDLVVSGHVASVVARIVPNTSTRAAEGRLGTLITVFEQNHGRWTIRSQVLAVRGPGTAGD